MITDHKGFAAFEAERIAVFSKIKAIMDADHFQCLYTPESIPDGLTLVSFDETRKPNDIEEDWATLDIPTDLLLQYSVDVYLGPRGAGYIMICRVKYNDETWEYQEHHGVENRASGEWRENGERSL